MSKLIFAFLLVTSSLLGQESMYWRNEHNPHCPFLVGVDLPEGKYPTKMPLYFVHRYTKPPECFIDEGEAQFIENPNTEFVRVAGKPASHVVIRCREKE